MIGEPKTQLEKLDQAARRLDSVDGRKRGGKIVKLKPEKTEGGSRAGSVAKPNPAEKPQ